MTFPMLPKWHGWLSHYGYTHADPFSRPLPIPSVGIFDSPDETICFNSKWTPILVGALSRLNHPELYIVDGSHDGIWASNEAEKLIGAVAGGDNPCLPQSITETQCAYYPSWYAGIEYLPYNPFSDTELPDGYNVAPFFRFGVIDTWFPNFIDDWFFGAIENLTGYRENDIFVSFFSLPTFTNPFDGLDYPTIKLTVQGTGKVSLKLLLVPFGGRALISLDSPDIGDVFNAIFSTEDRIIELNRDIIATVPETDLDAIEEIFFDTEGTHEIYITFLPTINDEAPIFQFGGGFRGYELCGALTLIDPITGLPVDTQSENVYQQGVIVATEQDLYNALLRFQTEQANRWLLASSEENIISPIKVGTDGEIIIDKTGQAATGDPIESTAQEAYNGGVYNQALRVKAFFDDMNQQKIDGFLASTISKLAQFAVDVLDAVNLDIALLSYVNGVEVINIDVAKLAEELYCNGDFSIGLLYYALGNHTENEINEVISITSYFLPSTFDRWYNEGTNTPRNDYISFPCYRQPSHTVTLTPDMVFNGAGGSINVDGVFPPLPNKSVGNRWNFQVSGRFVHTPTGGIFTMFYYTLDNVVWSSTSAQVRLNVGQTKLFDAIPIVNLDGTYTAYHTQGYALGIFGLAFGARPNWIDTDVVGSITVTKHDLGAG